MAQFGELGDTATHMTQVTADSNTMEEAIMAVVVLVGVV